MDVNEEINKKYRALLLDDIPFPKKFDSIINKIKIIVNDSATVGDVLDVDVYKFSWYNGVGDMLINLLVSLKDEIKSMDSMLDEVYKYKHLKENIGSENVSPSSVSSVFLLSDEHKKLFSRINSLNSNPLLEFNCDETIEGILELDVGCFSRVEGVGKKYVKALIDFKKTYNKSNKIELETPFKLLALSDEHEKLLTRIENINSDSLVDFNIAETAKGILELDVDYFSRVEGVGKKYVKALIEVKEKLSKLIPDSKSDDYIGGRKSTSLIEAQLDLKKCYINKVSLSKEEKKLITKLEKNISDLNVSALINLTTYGSTEYKGISLKKRSIFESIKAKIINDVEKISNVSFKPELLYQTCLVTAEYYPISLKELDLILIDDIEKYLLSLDEMSQNIIISRWGFHCDIQTLEKIGERHNVTRERVRQLEVAINLNLLSNIRLHPKVLSKNIRGITDLNIKESMPNLSLAFEAYTVFISFLENLCGEKKGELVNLFHPHVTNNLLNDYFCNNKSPVEIDYLISDLSSQFGYSNLKASNVVRVLLENKQLYIDDGFISPRNLSKRIAVAHKLVGHQNGLPWKDIARLVNNSGCCKTKVNEERVIANYLSESEYIYQCERGAYKNLLYFNIGDEDVIYIIESVIEYLKETNVDSLNLYDFYNNSNDKIKYIDYFDVRHIIRDFGSDYGVFFNGRSSVDAVGLNPVIKRVTQEALILDAMNKSQKALTVYDIAKIIRSKSVAHARFYLDKMFLSGTVVRVDYMMYTTTKKAFDNIDIESMLYMMDDILMNTSKIIESDIFRININRELNVAFPKYFYSSLANKYKEEFGWFRKYNFISCHEIPYKNMSDAISTLCNKNLSNDENIKIIKDNILLSDQVANDSIRNWKFQNT